MSELALRVGAVSGLVLAIACSSNGRTTQTTERAKDSPVAVGTNASPDAAMTTGSIDAMPDALADDDDLDDAFGGLSSEHGARDVKPAEWWRARAAKVRPGLRAQLEDGHEDIMSDEWAVRILGDIGDPADVPLLEKVLTVFKYETILWTAAEALGKNPSPDATVALIAATNHQQMNVATAAADGLGLRKNDAAARTRLEELINHPSSDMRFHAANALGDMGGSKAALQKRRKIEKDAEVRGAITKALRKK
jgi:hypothetical protein